MAVLVTGGAGYIGAHVTRLLLERGDDVVVIDDLSTGAAARTGRARLVTLDIAVGAAVAAIERTILDNGVDAIVHLAAKKRVGESVDRPTWYAQQNVGGLTNVLVAAQRANVDRLVFSSSAAVYGMPDITTVAETTQPNPINPYGRTKLFGEWMVEDAANAWGLRAANLRYFNVAGAGWPDLGDPAALNLVTMVFEQIDRGEHPLIFGDDYPTSDGTCIRDYVHVLDLAQAHIAALDYLSGPREFMNFNVGTGFGHSVREVIDAIATASGRTLEPVVVARRAGDPPQLVADVARIHEVLGWRAEHSLPGIIQSAWTAHLRTMEERVR